MAYTLKALTPADFETMKAQVENWPSVISSINQIISDSKGKEIIWATNEKDDSFIFRYDSIPMGNEHLYLFKHKSKFYNLLLNADFTAEKKVEFLGSEPCYDDLTEIKKAISDAFDAYGVYGRRDPPADPIFFTDVVIAVFDTEVSRVE